MTKESDFDSQQGKRFSYPHRDHTLMEVARLLEKASPLTVSRKGTVHVTSQLLVLGFLLAA
jgi:hypothetical protein